MEKYSRWRDPGTGIQPFLPAVPPRTESSLLRSLVQVVRWIVGPVQSIIKLSLVLILSLQWIVAIQGIGSVLSLLGPIGRVWIRCLSAILMRTILFCSGFYYIKSETTTLRKRAHQASKNKKTWSVRSGDAIVANWTSYIDVLYLAFRFNPVFTTVEPSSGKVSRISLWQAIRLPAYHANRVESLDSTKYSSLKQLVQEATAQRWGPVVVFPECTTSNGRALLTFAPVFREYRPNTADLRVHILAFRYEYRYQPPTFTVGNQLLHFAALCFQFSNSLTVKLLPAEDTLSKWTANDSDSQEPPESVDDPIGGSLRTMLSNIGKLRTTQLGITDKREFLDYYHTKSKNTKQKSR